MRNPPRTASTASALMIGLALVTLVGVLAAGLRTRFESSVNQEFNADYALTSTDNFSPIRVAPARTRCAGAGRDRRSRASVPATGARSADTINVTGVAPNVNQVIFVKWQVGSQRDPGAARHQRRLRRQGLRVRAPPPRRLTARRSRFRPERSSRSCVKGISAPPKGGSPYGDVTISQALFDADYQNPQNLYTFLNMAGRRRPPANTAPAQAALRTFPDAKVQTKSQFEHNQEQGLDTLLNLLYVLLSLSIIVSLFGIVNTLVLTVFERTRELGMLRAVGMTRRQVRRMIRHESVITASARRRVRDTARRRARADGRRRDRLPRIHDPVGHPDRVRDRRDPRRADRRRSSRRGAPGG